MTGTYETSFFIDSNIWIYALADRHTPQKRSIACSLVDSDSVVISTQVINEVCINLVKKSSFNETQVQELIQSFYDGCRVIELNENILTDASKLRTNYAFSFWDSLVVASAIYAKVSILYSEDMQDGLIVAAQLEIVNPFRASLSQNV